MNEITRIESSAQPRQAAFVNGRWVAEGGNRIEVLDPADGSLVGWVPDLGEAGAREAVAAAERAFPAWRAADAADRARKLQRWYELIVAKKESLARLLTREQGKPLAEARAEIAYGAGFVLWFAEEARRTYGQTLPRLGDRRIITLREPVGVCAAITPWNFPVAMITRKCAPAIAAGCTVVVKPSELTPFSALALAELAEEAEIPAGVFNVVTGAPEAIGAVLTGDMRVRKLSFTGSTRIGKVLMSQCAGNVKRLSLELGGNAPFVVFEDANLDIAISGLISNKFRNGGQTCVCANRVFVADAIRADFMERLIARVSALKVGPGQDPDSTIGPMINEAGVRKIEEHVADAVTMGAKVILGGRRHALGGTFFEPTILTDVTAEMRCAREETFGPVVPLTHFASEAEVVAQANATPYGLAAFFYTRDIDRAWRVAENLEAGMIGVNSGLVSTEVAPFGGVKESGIGREGGPEGIEEFLETKTLHFGPGS